MLHAIFEWRDNNGGSAETKIWLGDLPYPVAEARAIAFAEAMAAISTAALWRLTIHSPKELAGVAPKPGSDCGVAGLLLLGEADAPSSFLIPSPAYFLTETTGFYQAIRARAEVIDNPALAAFVNLLAENALDEAGRHFKAPALAAARLGRI